MTRWHACGCLRAADRHSQDRAAPLDGVAAEKRMPRGQVTDVGASAGGRASACCSTTARTSRQPRLYRSSVRELIVIDALIILNFNSYSISNDGLECITPEREGHGRLGEAATPGDRGELSRVLALSARRWSKQTPAWSIPAIQPGSSWPLLSAVVSPPCPTLNRR